MKRLLRTLVASTFACLLLPLGAGQQATAADVTAAPTTAQADPIGMTSGFYTDPGSTPAVWAAANPGDGRAAAIRDNIASHPMARWFGSWSGDIGAAVGSYVGAADAADKLPVLIAYNIPGRDACGGHSGGGAGTPSAYHAWISAFASAIGARPALVVIEPDSLGDFSCLTQTQIDERNTMLRDALAQFSAQAPNTWTYLDAGNPAWIDAATMAQHLDGAGARQAHGFSLNISNYYGTGENSAYGNAINSSLSASYGYTKPYVIDTSRNGNGSDGAWCNPGGRRTGAVSQTGGGAEMLLWLKTPGESDGDCGVGTGSVAGQFLPEVAYKMIYGY
ncbi:glycoside hydrolase family 6 protein [Streptomyces griseus]|uniref:glycoside hydrolase family 6 protein n=1 Tax=Streptomyces griseus TaxID=1911 RepID=UPI0038687720|nr:glycoside hydrolase family 6 protein [Streptomyces griseus]WTD70030.1 glycoside hydrolase family 6 protein [Streptomyces griseus]